MHKSNQVGNRIDEIRLAFKDVSLGHGTTLEQAMALDNDHYESELDDSNKTPNSESWQAIPRQNLDKLKLSLCFMNAEGFRYHIPIFMIASLECNIDFHTPVFHLTFNNQFIEKSETSKAKKYDACTPEKFQQHYQFDKPQCQAIANFLSFVVDEQPELLLPLELKAINRWVQFVF